MNKILFPAGLLMYIMASFGSPVRSQEAPTGYYPEAPAIVTEQASCPQQPLFQKFLAVGVLYHWACIDNMEYLISNQGDYIVRQRGGMQTFSAYSVEGVIDQIRAEDQAQARYIFSQLSAMRFPL